MHVYLCRQRGTTDLFSIIVPPASSCDPQCHDFFAESCFTDNDHKVHYYTGLPNSVILVAAFEYMVPIVLHAQKQKEIIIGSPT